MLRERIMDFTNLQFCREGPRSVELKDGFAHFPEQKREYLKILLFVYYCEGGSIFIFESLFKCTQSTVCLNVSKFYKVTKK